MTTDKNAQRLAGLNAQQRAAIFLQLKERQRKEGQRNAGIPLRSRAERAFPLSFAQQRLWFLDQLEPGSSLYTIPQILRLSGPLQVGALVRAIEVLVARHETLRTTFTAIDGVPRQVVEERGIAAFALIDLRACEMTIREELALKLACEEVQRPFDLLTGPLLRVTVLRLSEQEHLLLLLIHHIISDAWSGGILLQELFTLMESFAHGKTVQLPSLSLHYVDFALWQQEQLQGATLERLLAYWKTQLAHIPMLQLPFDHPRPAQQTFRGEVESLLLPVELMAPVRALAQQEGATLFMILLTAFKVLLYRYTNQEDITVGSLIANRTSAELEGLIGFFVNTLVLHTSVDGSLTFRELLGRIREVCLGAYAHQDLPFERLVEELQPERSLSYSPLFQVLFTLQNAPEAKNTLAGLEISPLDLGPSIAKFDLSLYVAEHAENISVTAEYNADLFEAATIRRLLTHFQTLLAGCVASPDRRVACLLLLNPEERRYILSAWNATAQEYPAERCLHQLFEQQAAATPEAVAVVFEDHVLTYQELNVRADKLAHYLQHMLHVGQEVPVGIYIERSLEMLIGLLGILKAGGAYVPLDPDYPQARLALILEDANPGIVLTQAHLRERISGIPIISICLDADWQVISHASSTILPTAAHPSKLDGATAGLAYIIYTSGSTGRPKGVQVTHRALINFLTSMSRQPGLTQHDILLAVTSLSFDIAGLELYLPLVLGARLVIASRDLARDGEQLMQALAFYGATTMQATPSTWRMLLEAGWQDLSHLRILCGGEALPPDLGQQLLQKGAMLWNLYGPTETTIWSAIYRVEGVDGIAPPGYPIANTQIYVLDAQLEPVPIGVPGELYIGGHGLSRGYFKQAALTAEKFLPDPFSSVPGMRLYRTGDLASYRADGVLKFLGRTDHQVKVHGFRIELQEIESVLNQHPGVFESVVSTHGETSGGKRLIAYVVPDVHHVEDYMEVDNPQERVSHWLTVWDTIYTADTPLHDPTFNLSGWKSSYTQEPISSEEMREWVDTTVERLRVHKLDRVLEIGCGTGLLFFQLAPLSDEYWATDFSPGVLAQVQQQVQKLNLAGVRLLHREACDFTGIPEGFYDLVILNSVVQYFPDIDYLLRVLAGAVKAVKPGGIIFLGDLRSLPLLQAFHASIQLLQAPDNLPRTDLLQLVRIRAAQEEELLIDPALFTALQQYLLQISQVETQLRRGRYHNELTRFRYDVLLHIRTQQEPRSTSGATLAVAPAIHEGDIRPSIVGESLAPALELDWRRERLTLTSLRQHVQRTAPQALYISGVPNARLLAPLKAYELLAVDAGAVHVGDLRETLHALLQQDPGIEPEEFWRLGAEYLYSVSVTWSRAYGPGYFDVILSQAGSTISDPPLTIEQGKRKPWTAYANTPLRRPVPQRLAPALRHHLKQHLPEYMLPATFVFLPALPLTPNGKIDRRALPVPDYAYPRLKEAYTAPSSRTETILAEVCAQTLDIEQVGIHDNFFELGGNSLLVIRFVAKANKAGLPITAKQVFLHQTVARLAEVVGTAPILADQELAIGPTPPTPGQCPVLAESVAHPEYFNLAYFVFAQERLSARFIRQLVRELVAYHDALRICRAPAGSPLPLLIKELSGELSCVHVDLSRLSEAEVLTTARRELNALQTSMHLDRGPLFQVVLFDCGPEQSSILLLIGHYLVADIEAWQILLEDVITAYQQLTDTGRVQLPARSTSFKQWAERLHTFVRSAALENELTYWLAEARWRILPLPLDYPQGRNTIGSSRTIETELTSEETTALLSRTLKRYDTQMDALLITAIALACLPWNRQESLLVSLFSHGRESLFEDMDVSRTVGTFGTDFPVLITLASTLSLEEALYQVKAQLAQVPNHGIGYGILRHLSPSEQARRLRAMPEAEIVVNYIGATFNDPRQPRFQIFGPYTGHHHDQETDRGHKLQITGQVFEGKLQLRWDYSENLHHHATIESLARQTIEFIRSILVLQPGSLMED